MSAQATSGADLPEIFRGLLCQLGESVRDSVIAARRVTSADSLASVAGQTAADTIYAIDRVSEDAVAGWFDGHWPADEPVEIVMEGPEEPLTFPRGIAPAATKWKCILDPIDGTRGIMYDKRPAWVLSGIAPQRGGDTMLSDLFVASMTELPTTKQWRADQLSAVAGRGLVAGATNILDGTRLPLPLKASGATDFGHGFSSFARFFPEGKTLTSQIEECLWDELVGIGKHSSPTIFDDQYISTGGQFYELLSGHDRLIADLRPLVYAALDLDSSLVCHPYDVAAALLLREGGVVYEHPLGGFPDAPLDTTSPITWIAYANPTLAALARPILRRLLGEML